MTTEGFPVLKKCGVCSTILNGEVENLRGLCWLCLRLKNSAQSEVHYNQQPEG